MTNKLNKKCTSVKLKKNENNQNIKKYFGFFSKNRKKKKKLHYQITARARLEKSYRGSCSGTFKQSTLSMPSSQNYLEKLSNHCQSKIHWLIHFNGMSTCLGLFYALILGNCINCTFIFTLFVLFLRSFFCEVGGGSHTVLSNTNDFQTDL